MQIKKFKIIKCKICKKEFQRLYFCQKICSDDCKIINKKLTNIKSNINKELDCLNYLLQNILFSLEPEECVKLQEKIDKQRSCINKIMEKI